jgi:hypothetical protein
MARRKKLINSDETSPNDRLISTLKVLANGITLVSRPCRVQGDDPLDRSSLSLTARTVQIAGLDQTETRRFRWAHQGEVGMDKPQSYSSFVHQFM